MSSEVSVRYCFPDPGLFALCPVLAQVSVADGHAVRDLAPPDMPVLSFSLSGRWTFGDRPDAMMPGETSAMLHGPSSRGRWYGGESGEVVIAALHPLAWPLWFGVKARDFANKSVPLGRLQDMADVEIVDSLRQCQGFEARIAVLNRWLLGLPQRPVPEALSTQLIGVRMALMDPDCASVEDMAARVKLSGTQLARLCQACFGFTPKILIQRERFRRMLHRADAHSYAIWREFIEGQYVDQSHMIRDFRRFLGMAPSHYFRLERPFVSAAFAEARRLLGKTPM